MYPEHFGMMRSTLLPLIFALLAPASLGAQVLPVQSQDVQREMREYNAEVLKEYHGVMNEWAAAWQRQDARALAQHYTDDAILYMDGAEPVQTRRAIEERFRQVLPTTGVARLGVVDFVVSGSLAFGSGRYTYEDGSSIGAAALESGTYTVLLRREGRRWRIRSQLFRAEDS